jgi:hypothetical protein
MRARHGVGHGVDPELGGLGRRRACQSGRWSTRNCALDPPRHIRGARRPVDMWTTQKCCHRPTGSKIKSKRQFDCFESTALKPGPSQTQPSARAAATPVAAFGIYPGRHSHQLSPAKEAVSVGMRRSTSSTTGDAFADLSALAEFRDRTVGRAPVIKIAQTQLRRVVYADHWERLIDSRRPTTDLRSWPS